MTHDEVITYLEDKLLEVRGLDGDEDSIRSELIDIADSIINKFYDIEIDD